MRHGLNFETGVPGKPCRLPETEPYSTDQNPFQRFLAFAYLQAQENRRQAEEELQKDADTLSAVLAAQSHIADAQLNLEQSLELISETACRLTGAGGAAIALRDGAKVVCRGRSGLLAPDLGSRLNPQFGVCGECLSSGEVQFCDDTEHDRRVDVWVCRNLGIRSILAVPVRRQQDVLGIVVAFSGWAGVFVERDMRTLKLLAGLVIEALWAHEVHQSSALVPKPAVLAPALEPGDGASLPVREAAALAAGPKIVESPAVKTPARTGADLPVPTFALLGTAEPWRRGRTEEVPALDKPPATTGGELPVPTFALLGRAEPGRLGRTVEVVGTPATTGAEVPAPAFAMLGKAEGWWRVRVAAIILALIAILAGGRYLVLSRGAHIRELLHAKQAAVTMRVREWLHPGQTAITPPLAAATPSPIMAPVPETPSLTPTAEPVANAAPEILSESTPPSSPSQLLSVRFWSKPETTTIALFLQGSPRWESGRLKDPEQIYFDLMNTQLAAEVRAKSREGLAIPVKDKLVRRIRVSPRETSGVRVLIDLAAPAEYSAVPSLTEPYRLMIVVRRSLAPHSEPPNQEPALPKRIPASKKRAPESHAMLGRHPRIVIDPGHGGSEDGAVGHGGLKEKDVVLEVSRRLGDLLANRLGAEVIYTRTTDLAVPLDARAAIANQARADLFISIHANSSDDAGARGVETYYVASNPSPVAVSLTGGENTPKVGAVKPVLEEHKLSESHKLAVQVQQALYQAFGGEKGVLNRGVKQAPFLVLLDADMPSILAEVAFVTSRTDERRLGTADGQEKVADALYRGIARYLSAAGHGKVMASLGAASGQ